MGYRPGDEVLLPAYTFFASASAILLAGAKPIFVDIDPSTYCLDPDQVERCISPRSRAMMPVHLYGQPANMEALSALAKKHSLTMIEDNAQAFGAEYHGQKTAGLGEAGCLSFFPTKNLGGYGDGGMLVTNNPDVLRSVPASYTPMAGSANISRKCWGITAGWTPCRLPSCARNCRMSRRGTSAAVYSPKI